MRTVSCCVAIFIVTIIPTTPVIYSLKFVIAFNFLRNDFLPFSSSDCFENQPVLGLGVRQLGTEVAYRVSFKRVLKTVLQALLLKHHPANFHCMCNVNCVAPEKKYIQVAYQVSKIFSHENFGQIYILFTGSIEWKSK